MLLTLFRLVTLLTLAERTERGASSGRRGGQAGGRDIQSGCRWGHSTQSGCGLSAYARSAPGVPNRLEYDPTGAQANDHDDEET